MAVFPPKHPELSSTASFLGKFCVLFFILEYAYWLIPDGFLRDVIYAKTLVAPCVWLIHLLSPGEHLVARSNMLISPGASLEIVRGCDGAGVIFLLLAATLAFTSSFGKKLHGVMMGVSLLVLVNTLRIIVLYFIAAYKPTWFVVIHSYWAPTLMIVIACLIFALWSQSARLHDS